jgi:hypothetical protein
LISVYAVVVPIRPVLFNAPTPVAERKAASIGSARLANITYFTAAICYEALAIPIGESFI